MASQPTICIQAITPNTKKQHLTLSWYDLGAKHTQFASVGQTNKVHLRMGWSPVQATKTQPPYPKASNPILYIPSIIWNTSEAHWTLPLQKSWTESAQTHTVRLVVPWCHLWRVWVQCGPNIYKDPPPWPPNQPYVSRQSHQTPRNSI